MAWAGGDWNGTNYIIAARDFAVLFFFLTKFDFLAMLEPLSGRGSGHLTHRPHRE
jgi:hypothetical protein